MRRSKWKRSAVAAPQRENTSSPAAYNLDIYRLWDKSLVRGGAVAPRAVPVVASHRSIHTPGQQKTIDMSSLMERRVGCSLVAVVQSDNTTRMGAFVCGI
ncbi:hypothetical protein Tco_0550276 [Tanacetum coccineum]